MKSTNIPQLSINIEGLKLYSILLVFAPGPALSSEDYRLRAWLLHTLGTAAKQYTRARDLVLLHEQADQAKDGGVILYVLDVSEQLEGCVMALHRVLAALKRMYRSETSQPIDDQSDKFAKLRSIRNQFEHMHS